MGNFLFLPPSMVNRSERHEPIQSSPPDTSSAPSSLQVFLARLNERRLLLTAMLAAGIAVCTIDLRCNHDLEVPGHVKLSRVDRNRTFKRLSAAKYRRMSEHLDRQKHADILLKYAAQAGLHERADDHYETGLQVAEDIREAALLRGDAVDERRYAVLYFWKGVSLEERGNRLQAIDFFQRSLRADPDGQRVFVHLIGCLDALGRTDEAGEALKRLDVFPGGIDQLLARADAQLIARRRWLMESGVEDLLLPDTAAAEQYLLFCEADTWNKRVWNLRRLPQAERQE